MIAAVLTSALLGQSITVKTVRVQSEFRILSLCAGATGSTFFASLEDKSIRLMDAANGNTRLVFSGHPQPVYALAVNPKGTIMASGDESARVWLWDLKKGAKLREFTRTNAHTRGIISASFSADGKHLLPAGRDDFLVIWDVATGKPIKKIPGNGDNVAGGVYSPKGGFFCATLGKGVMVNRSGATKFWGGHSGRGVTDFAVDRKGTRGISGGNDQKVTFWDLASGKALATGGSHDDMVIKVAMAPNGAVGASSSVDREVFLWSAKGQKIGRISDQSAIGSPLAFTADGKYLLTSNVSDSLQTNLISPAQAPKK